MNFSPCGKGTFHPPWLQIRYCKQIVVHSRWVLGNYKDMPDFSYNIHVQDSGTIVNEAGRLEFDLPFIINGIVYEFLMKTLILLNMVE